MSKYITRNLIILFAVVLLYLAILSFIFTALVTLPVLLRAAIAVLLIAPLGLLMGSFLPLAIQAAGNRFEEIVPWAWGLNGATSVFGSILSIALAMNVGYNATLVIGMAFYLFGYLMAHGLWKQTAAVS